MPNERHICRVEACDILIMMLSGVLRFTENGNPVEICPGEYYIQRSGLYQDGPLPSDSPEYFYIHFTQGVWTDKAPFLPCRGVCDGDSLLPLMKELEDAERVNAPYIVKSGLLCTFLSRLYQGRKKGEKEEAVEGMIRRLTEDLKNVPSLSQLSGELHFSENYLIRIFREITNTTPHAYVNYARIRRAKLLLTTGNITIDRIAYECGYADYAHFYRMFVRETNMSPGEYRKRNRQIKG